MWVGGTWQLPWFVLNPAVLLSITAPGRWNLSLPWETAENLLFSRGSSGSRFSLGHVLTLLHPALFLEQLISLESTSYGIWPVTSTGEFELPHVCMTALFYLKKNCAEQQWGGGGEGAQGVAAGPRRKISIAFSATSVWEALVGATKLWNNSPIMETWMACCSPVENCVLQIERPAHWKFFFVLDVINLHW